MSGSIPFLLVKLAQEDMLDNFPEDICSCENEPQDTDHGKDWDNREGSPEYEEFAPETCQSRKTQGSKTSHHHDAVVIRHLCAQSTEVFDLAGVGPVVNHTNQEKQPTRDDTVGEELQRCAV